MAVTDWELARRSAPAGHSIRNPHLRALAERAEVAKARARRLVGGIVLAQLDWSPAPRAWSIGQCLEHLVLTGARYHELMSAALARAWLRRPPATSYDDWPSSLFGRLLHEAVRPEGRRRRAPRILDPRMRVRPDVLRSFLEIQADYQSLLKAADGMAVEEVRLHSPVSRLVRLHLGDCFRILAAHTERHLDQAERVRAHPAFPA
ncbi:MAG TPA: DinB family protein [Gemmatimonadales bacterium]|nr:DinB family protein [Gemmatimonadales bacterium]